MIGCEKNEYLAKNSRPGIASLLAGEMFIEQMNRNNAFCARFGNVA